MAARLLVALALVLAVAAPPASAVTTVFAPPARAGFESPGVMYARAVTLHHNGRANGAIVATFETYSSSRPYFPVFESTDGGSSWRRISIVTDTVNGYGMRWNPQIYELPERLGVYPAGTLLVAGLSVPRNMSSTEILLYASTDRGRTWELAGSIAKGGPAYPTDPFTPVWEPFLLMRDGRLIVFYSDQRENKTHSQKLVHQVSADGVTWARVVDDVADAEQESRPGMPTVAQIGDGRWILTYEVCSTLGGECPVRYRIAGDPERFATAPARDLLLIDGDPPAGHPYVTWTPSGGPFGTIAVGYGSGTDLAVNRAGGDPYAWSSDPSHVPSGYSRSLMVTPDGSELMTLTGGDHDSPYLNRVQLGSARLAPPLRDGTYTATNAYSGLTQRWAIARRANGYFALRAAGEWAIVRQTDGSFTIVDRVSGVALGAPGWGAWTADRRRRWTLTRAGSRGAG